MKDGARSIVERRIARLLTKAVLIEVEIAKQRRILAVMDEVGAPERIVRPAPLEHEGQG
jgi:hypothetical protein